MNTTALRKRIASLLCLLVRGMDWVAARWSDATVEVENLSIRLDPDLDLWDEGFPF